MPANTIFPRSNKLRILTDSFSGVVSGNPLANHVPELPFNGGKWLCDAVWKVEFDDATYNPAVYVPTPAMAFAQLDQNVLDTRFWIQASVFRGNDDPFVSPYGECGGVCFLQVAGGIANGEGCMVFVRSVSGPTVDLVFQRRSAVGSVLQETIFHAGLAANPQTTVGRLGAIVYGTAVYPTLERNGVTTVYSSIAIPDLRDGLHRRLGLCALTGDPSGRYFMDSLYVDYLD